MDEITSAFHQTLRDHVPAIPSHNNLHPERNPVVAEPSIPESLLSLEELDVRYDSDQAALWTFMRPRNRSSFTPTVLADFETWQSLIAQNFGPKHIPLRYLILGSRVPGVFSNGGDLDLFLTLIDAQDRDGLRAYGYRCVEILDRNRRCLDLPIVTVGLESSDWEEPLRLQSDIGFSLGLAR